MLRALAFSLVATALAVPAAGAANQSGVGNPPLLVILSDTTRQRDGLPVFTRHPDERRYLEVLEHGYLGRLVKLYRWVQTRRFTRDGTTIEPAYLALTDHQGGFPRAGFYLDDRPKRKVVGPLENVYLKLFHVFDRAKPHDAAALLRGYLGVFADEAAGVEQIARAVAALPPSIGSPERARAGGVDAGGAGAVRDYARVVLSSPRRTRRRITTEVAENAETDHHGDRGGHGEESPRRSQRARRRITTEIAENTDM